MPARPAQGDNSRPAKRPGPAYVQDPGPTVVSSGSLSRPKSPTSGGFKGARLVADATPRVVQS